MADYVSAVLGEVLQRTILIAAIIIVMKLLWEGAFVPAGGLLIPLLVFAYLVFGDPTVLD